jgi:YVTN family beta-propeller protein
VKDWGKKGTGPGEFDVPHSIVIDSKGLLYVGDRENNRIQIFDTDGNFVREWDKIGSPWGLFITPGPDQVIYMSDGAANRVLKLDLNGNILGAFGESGKQPGQFEYAHGIAVGPKNEIYVAEILNWRVQKLVPAKSTASTAAADPKCLVYVANHSDDTVSVVDTSTNKVVQVIDDIEAAHSVDFSPDASRVYISVESEKTLDVIDQKTGKIIKKVPLIGMPNTIAVSKDGGRVFVGIREAPGAVEVIDTKSLEKSNIIPTSPLHDIYVTPDGKYLIVGSEEARSLTVIDTRTEKPVWDLKFEQPVRTMAIETNPDGSTRRIFVNTSFLHGFEVVDFAKQKIVDTIRLPDQPNGGNEHDNEEGHRVPSHGIGVAPDGKTLWVNSKMADAAFVYSLPNLKLLGYALTGEVPDWITFTPDSKLVYISNTVGNTVSAIDVRTMKEVARIEVGHQPKRIKALELH